MTEHCVVPALDHKNYNLYPVKEMMRKRVSIAPVKNGREAEIQFDDEKEAVGVGPVTVRFLERFSGHASCLHSHLMVNARLSSGSHKGNSI